MKFLLILDIDETFLHLVNGHHIIPSDYPYDKVSLDTTSTIYYRPGFAEFIKYASENRAWLTLGIWTYGNKLYADMNHRYLLDKFDLPEDMFLIVYSETEIKKDLKNGLFEKDLRRVFIMHPEYTEKNTFLVDNRPANIYHMANKENGIIVESFIPTNLYYNPYQDYVFEDLIYVCNKLRNAKHINKPIFHKDYVNAHGLGHFHKSFIVGGEKTFIMATGNIDEDDIFYYGGWEQSLKSGGAQSLKSGNSAQSGNLIKSTRKLNKRWKQTKMRNKLRKINKNLQKKV